MTKNPPLTQVRIFWFWLPLAAMWLMMAFEQPAIAAVVARLPDPERNLAAVGVTFSVALIAVGAEWMYLWWRSRPEATQMRAAPAGRAATDLPFE